MNLALANCDTRNHTAWGCCSTVVHSNGFFFFPPFDEMSNVSYCGFGQLNLEDDFFFFFVLVW